MNHAIGDFARLQAALGRAWRCSPFHRTHWLAAGVPEGWIPAAPGELERLPVVTKEHLLAAQSAAPPWGRNLCIGEREIAQMHLTSGTSGIGQERYAASAADVHVMGASWAPQYRAIGLNPGDVAVLTIPVSFFCAGLSAFEGARLYGLIPLITGVASKDMILDLVAQHRAAYLYGTESLLLQLGHLIAERGHGHDFGAHLKGIQAVGSSAALCATARENFGCRLHEVYGCTQAAAKIATTCALGVDEGTLHFHDEHLYIETRDPATGVAVTEGRAEIILSTSYREASPVFRFAIRDAVELVPAGRCACGDPRPGFKPGSLTRIDSMAKIRGVNVWPQALEQVLLAHPAVREFRAVVRRREDGADELLIRVALRGALAASAALAGELEAAVRRRTMVRPRIEFDPGIVEEDGQYKQKRWSDQRKPAAIGVHDGGIT